MKATRPSVSVVNTPSLIDCSAVRRRASDSASRVTAASASVTSCMTTTAPAGAPAADCSGSALQISMRGLQSRRATRRL